jgi:hypothetical protein
VETPWKYIDHGEDQRLFAALVLGEERHLEESGAIARDVEDQRADPGLEGAGIAPVPIAAPRRRALVGRRTHEALELRLDRILDERADHLPHHLRRRRLFSCRQPRSLLIEGHR